ncbi:MAG: DEAD/DEAH box helicase family protein [Anaerolineaceae bacterium]|nr:DEAD/DEAH box helicase family protein [Anaerolineaceae bacterium]
MKIINESKTRKELIDPALEKAGWHLRDKSRVGIEIPVDGYDKEPWNGVTDYCLYRANGEVMAVVEAKRTTTDPRLAEAQATHYVTEIAKHQSFQPYVFLTNGYDVYFMDVGISARRQVYGFFTPDDLERMLFTRLNKAPLATIAIDNRITDRPYQHEAIRRVCEAFEKGQRKALIVMATGTGKTRTTMSIIDLFLRANQAQNVLFVADRDALVEQAISDGFRKFLPDEPCDRLYSHSIDQTKRLFAVTLQTLSNIFQQFSPAFFDLIIFDEVHRSIFNKFNEVLDYFDGRMIGLTATPAQFIDRDTFRAFTCEDGKPTFLYTYQQAIDEKYLVDYSLYAARTKFQRQGIKGVDLSEEERNSLIEQGLDPDEIDFEGTQLEKDVSNKGTLRKQWEELWSVCLKDQSGQLPGKTIIFAMTQEHALRLADVFNEMYPQFPNLIQVITHKSEYKGTLVKKFKHIEQPRIAVSVDMLDTGIDVPEITNLVFMKPVQSRIKIDQMIGRGTRSDETCKMRSLLPGGVKTEFLVIDFWENDFNKQAEETVLQTVPVLVTIFNTRLKLLETYLDDQENEDCQRVMLDLKCQVARIPRDSFTVKKVLPEIEEAWQENFWGYLTTSKLDFLRLKVGPLLRLAPDVDVSAETFISKVERLKLQVRTYKDTGQTVLSIAEDAANLPDFVVQDPLLGKLAKRCTSGGLEGSSMSELSEIAEKLAPQMKYRKKVSSFLTLDLKDVIELSGYIMLTQSGEKVYVKEYRQRVEQHILDFVASHPVLQAIGRGETVDDLQLLELERDLQKTLAGGELELSPDNIRRAYGIKVDSMLEFLATVLGLDSLPDYEQIVKHQFQEFTTRHTFNSDQVRFLRAVQSVFLQKRRLALADLYLEPLSNFGSNAVERWFSMDEVREILKLADDLSINVKP